MSDINELADLLGDAEEIELSNFKLEAQYLELSVLPQIIAHALGVKPEAIIELVKFKFTPPAEKYKSRINEVTLGATKSEGGTRSHKLKIGGQTTMPFYFFEGKEQNRPVISHDVFDMPISLPSQIKAYFGDAMEDPADWAKLRVKKFGAQMITLHMVSTDPTVKDLSVKDAAKIIEDVLQAVKVPIIIGGSGNPEKDPPLLEKAAEVCAGENVALSTVDPDMDYKRVSKAAVKHGHSVVSLVSMNPDEIRRLNKNLIKCGLREDQILMDPFTAGIGYGIEYSISAMERCRLAGLKGEKALAFPMVSATSNSWSAREAWMAKEEWGPREKRGPLWEAATALTALLCGADLFLMLHPHSIDTLDKMIDSLREGPGKERDDYLSWLNV
ncbi:MAG: CO dehydrogenase/acetyl-CoA synthase subunit delta [Candidatus Altiarchaeales archaeon IMC4]|nr:MAG: CO dehydrogenase/acetyl-CoA synthase subunit delta [Candidatus Altiarchaeales archaeon IMC4]